MPSILFNCSGHEHYWLSAPVIARVHAKSTFFILTHGFNFGMINSFHQRPTFPLMYFTKIDAHNWNE